MPLDATTAINVTIGGSSFLIWDEAFKVHLDRDGRKSRGMLRWRSKWSDAEAIAQLLLGGSNNSGGTTLFNNPAIFPRFGAMAALNAEITGDGIPSVGSDGFIVYERAEIIVNYGFPEYSAGDTQKNITEISIDGAIHTVPLDPTNSTWNYQTSPTPTPVPASAYPSYQITTYDFSLALTNRSAISIAKFMPYANCVNSQPMFNATQSFGQLATQNPSAAGIGQVLFRYPRSTYKMTAGQAPNFDIQLVFGFHPITDGWNSLPLPGNNPLWVKKLDGNGNPEHPYADLNQLFNL